MKKLLFAIILFIPSICFAFNDFSSGVMNTPVATTNRVGSVKGDGSTITIQSDGTISAVSGGTGDVNGPGASTANKVPQWNNTAGTLLKDGLAVGTAASNLIQLDANAYIPALDAHLLTGFAPGKYRYVDGSSAYASGYNGAVNFPYKTVQACIDASSSGDTCFIWPGSYTENLTFKAGVNLSTTGKFSVTLTGNHTATFAGTVVIENIILTSATGITLSASASGNSMNLQFIGSDINSGTGDAIYWANTNTASKLSITDGNVNVATSGVSSQAIHSITGSKGSFILNRSSVKLDNPANIAVALNGAISYTHTLDIIYGRVTVADTASSTIAMCTMTALGAANLTTNSSGTTLVAESIAISDTTPAFDGAGVFTFLALTEASTGYGGASTLNGGVGPIPVAFAPIKLRPYTLYPAGSVAGGYLSGTFEYNSIDTSLYFTQGTTRGIIPIATGVSTNHSVCWKSATTLGYCSDVVSATGTCTCN